MGASPSTSQRRNPASSINSTIARSRKVRNAPAAPSPPAVSAPRQQSRRPNQRDSAPAGTPSRQPSRHRVGRDRTTCVQVSEQPRHGGQPPLDRRSGKTGLAVSQPNQVAAAARQALSFDKAKHVRGRDLGRCLATTAKNTFRSNACADTVLGRVRAATNRRYSSRSPCPSYGTRPPPGPGTKC